MTGRKFKDGDTVKILKASYKDEIATIVSYTSGHSGWYSSTKGYYTVKRKNKQTVNLYSTEMELVSSKEGEEKKLLKWHLASKEELREAINNNTPVLVRPDLVSGKSMCTHSCTVSMAKMRGRTVHVYAKYEDEDLHALGVSEDKENYTWSPSCFAIEEKETSFEISVSHKKSTISDFNLGDPVGRKRRTLF